MIKAGLGGFVHGSFTGAAAGATFSTGSLVLKATGSVIKAGLAGFGADLVSGFTGGAVGSAAGQAITTGKINRQEVLKSAYSTAAGLAAAGMAAPALGAGSKTVGKALGKALGKAGMKEALAAGTATVAGMAGEGTLLGGIMAGVGDIAAQGYDIHAGIQTSINWKQTGKSTLTGGAAGFVMGGAMGMFSLTSAGQAFGKWMSEPTKLDLKAAEMVKSFWGNNRGSVGFGAKAGGSGTEIPWSSKVVSDASNQLDNGAKSVFVDNRSQAEELFLGKYQGKGYTNVTGMDAMDVKNLLGDKANTYHWDDTFGLDGYLVGHGAGNPDALMPHLQIHPEKGTVIRIFFENSGR